MPTPPRPPITHQRHKFTDRPRGQTRPSTTTIIDAATNTKTLIPWATRLTAQRAVDEHATLTDLLAHNRHKDAVTWLAHACEEVKKAAADNGTTVHAAAEAFVTTGSIPDALDPDVERAISHLSDYLNRTGVHLSAPEMCVYNTRLGYGGTFDALAQLPDGGPRVVVDFKTGRTGPYPSWALQVAAYAHCDIEVLPQENRPVPEDIDTQRALILRLRPDGCTPLLVDLPPAWRAFQGALQTWDNIPAEKNALFTSYDAPAANRLMDAIGQAPTTDALRRLYRQHYPIGEWSALHTEAANRRIKALHANQAAA